MEITYVIVNITDPDGTVLTRFKVLIEKADMESRAEIQRNQTANQIEDMVGMEYEVEEMDD